MQEETKKVNLSLQVAPINTENSYPIIDEAIRVIQASGVKHEVQPFSTVMEGELQALLAIVLEAKDAAFRAGAEELLLNIQIHLKRDGSVSFEQKTGKYRDIYPAGEGGRAAKP